MINVHLYWLYWGLGGQRRRREEENCLFKRKGCITSPKLSKWATIFALLEVVELMGMSSFWSVELPEISSFLEVKLLEGRLSLLVKVGKEWI